jgi:CheY-like chemotaxis protein
MPNPAPRPRILVVEDDPGIQSLMLAVIRRGGFDVETAANGIEAIAVLSRQRFAAVILDLLLPRSSGYDVLEWLDGASPDVLGCVIILSASSPVIVKKHALAHRVYRVMQKPFDIEELLDTVTACVGQAHADDPFLPVRMKSARANADTAILGVVGGERDMVHLVWSFGYDDATIAAYNPVPLTDKLPLTTSIVEARPVWLRSLSEITREYPLLLARLKPSTRSLAAVPIRGGDQVVSASIGWSFVDEQTFEPQQQELLLSIAADCAEFSKTSSSG